MEVMMLDQPRLVQIPRVHDDPGPAQVTQIRVRVVAVVILDGDVGEERVGGPLLLGYRVLAQQLVVGEIVDEQCGRGLLFGLAEDVDEAGVQDPEPVAAVGAHPERRDDLGHGAAAVLVGLPGGIGHQWWWCPGIYKSEFEFAAD